MAKKETTIDAAALRAELLGEDAPNNKEVSAETTSKGIDAAALRAEYLSNSAEESDADPTLGLKIGGMATRAGQHNLRATMRSEYNRKSALDGIEATDAASQSVANMVGEARKRGYMEAEQKRLKPLYDYLESVGDAGEGIKPIDFTQSTLGKSVEEMMPKSGQYIPRGKALLDIMDKNSGVTDKSEMYSNTDRLRAMYMLNPNMAKDSQYVEWNEHYPAPTTPIMTPSEDGLYHIGENTYTHEDMVNALAGYMPVAQHKRRLNYNKHYRDDYARSLGYKSWDDAWETPLKNLTKELEAINEELASETYDKMVSASAFETAPATEGAALGTYIADMMRGGLTAQQELEKAKALTADDFISGFDEGFNTVEVMSLGYAGIGASVNLYNILEKVNNDQPLSEREEKVYRAYEIGQELEQLHNEFRGGKMSRGRRWGQGVGTSTEAMAQFAASMAATGGIGSGIAAANTGIKQAFKQGLKSGLKQTVKMGGKKAGVYGARSAAAASFSPMTYSNFAERRVGQYHIGESGNLVKETRPWAKDLGIAYVETFNEYFSEYFGDGMGKLIDVSPSKIGRMFGLDKWAGKKGYGNIGDYLDATFVPTKRMREAMHHVDFAGFVWEAPSEAFGDFMSSLMLAPFSEEHGFEQFTTTEYWEDLYGTTAIFGGSLSVLGAPATIKNMYNTSKNVKRREAVLEKIQDVELRNNLKSVMSLDSMEEMSQAMVDLHIEKLSPDQAAAAVEYLTSATMVKVLTGADMENSRLLALDGFVKDVNNIVYKGKDGSLPSDEIIQVVDKNGRVLFVEAGDVNNTSDVSMLKCKTYDAENRKWVDVAVPASEVMDMKRESVEQVISAEYERMFGTEIMAERLKEIEGARKSMENPSAEVVRGHYLRNGLKVYDIGAEVSLADGRTAIVESMLADGSYLVRSVNPTTQTEELYEVPFMQVLQPETSLAEAQKHMFAKNIESATQSIQRAEVTEQSAEAGVAEEEDVDADMEDVVEQAQEMPKPVPTREDGGVDFSAIDDSKMFATEYAKKMGGEDKAKASVAKMAANARAEASQLREKSDKMTDPNEVVDAVAKADAMDAKADFYDKVLAEYAPQEEVQPETYKAGDVVEYDGRIAEVVGVENEGVVIADARGGMAVVDPTTLSRVAEAPAEENAVDPVEDADDKLIEETEAGIVQNVFGKMLDARTANVIDAMAKALGVKVAFVESVTTQAGTRANADIKGNVVRIAWAQRKKAISFLAGHEFTHRMKDMSPEAYAEFTKSVKEYLGEAEWQRRMNAQRATYESHNRRAKAEGKPLLSYEDALLEEEVVADFVGDMVENRHAFEHYVQKQSQKPSLLQTIKKVFSAIGSFFRRMGARTEAQRMKEMIAHLDTFINKAREDAKKNGVQESGRPRNSLISVPTFYSNAQYAVQNIKQEKATPEQWHKMIEKNGGLKAGEDKWLGLSDWLKASDKKTLTKDEVLQYIAENDIQIEEVSYGEPEYVSENEIYESDAFSNLVSSLTDYDEDDNPHINQERYKELQNADPDFLDGFSLDYFGEGLDIDDKMAAARYLGLLGVDNEINGTRLQYTTQGLTKKKEIALVVPTIEPYNQSDEIHFGDAGEGRAVAWVRFGDAEAQRSEEVVRRVDEFEAPYKDVNGHEIYSPKDRLYAKDFISYGKLKSGEYAYVVYVNDKQIPVAHKSLEDARNALNEHYKANPEKRTRWDKVLVIDEIQSKRHQDGREKGYSDRSVSQQELYEAQEAAFSKVIEYESALADKYGEDEWAALATAEEMAEYERLRALDEAATNAYENYDKGVPSAPFEKNWAELAFKRMLRYAAENGYDYVAWTTGDQQADRYNLGKMYDAIEREDNPNVEGKRFVLAGGNYDNLIVDDSGVVTSSSISEAEGKSLVDVVGKDMAEKMMSLEDGDSISGDGLRIGGEGMRGFYDQMLPSFVKKYTKKWGAEVGEVTMPDLEENNTMHAVNVTDSMRESVMQGQPKFSLPSLVGVHNLSLDKLRKVIKMGGLANPSVAVIDVDKQTHDDYGEYSLVLPKNMVDAQQGKNAGTWAGDAWTPTYPQVVKRMNDDKAISRFYKDIDALPEAMRSRVRLDFDSFMDGRSANALAYWYLFEKGNAPEMVLVPSRYSNDVTNAVSEATKGSFSMFNLTPEERAKCLDAYIAVKFDGDRAAFEAEMQARIERLAETIETKKSDRVKKWAQDTIDSIKEYGFDYDDVATFIRDVEYDAREKGKVNVDATILAAQERINESNLAAEYDAWRNNLDERYGIEEYIFDGYTSSGNRRYLPHTVENASKWMKKQGREGAVATFPSFGTFVAVSIPKMTTLESIRKRKALLGKSKEEYDAFREKWENVYYELGKKLQPDAKSFEDYGYWRLIEAVGQKNPKEFIKKQYGVELSEEDMTQLNEMLNAIRTEYPARYFETKFERPLQLSDFTAAVVPNDIPLDVESRLKDANVEVIEYEKGDNASRAEAMQKASEMEDVRFSLQETNERFNAELAALTEEDARFERKVAFLRDLVREYNIPLPTFIAQTKEEFKRMLLEYGVPEAEFDEDKAAGYYSEDDDIIFINGGLMKKPSDISNVLLHENAHNISVKQMREKIAIVAETLSPNNVNAMLTEFFDGGYKDLNEEEIVNEVVSYMVGYLQIDKTIPTFEGQISIEEFIDAWKEEIANSRYSNYVKEVFFAALPLVKENINYQKKQYGAERTNTIVIPRKEYVGSVEGGYAESSLQSDKESRPIEAFSRNATLDRRGQGADAQEVGYRHSIEEIIDTPSDEEYKQQMLELAQQMERDAEERNLDKAQEIADVTGWVHFDDGTWQYYGNVDITEDAKESTRVRRWLESKAAVKKARTRKMYDDLLKEQKKVTKELESESKARRSNASYAKAVDAILQGQAHEALPIEDQILVDVALGQKLRWEDEQGGSRRGLKTELGLRSTTAEGMAEVTGGNTYIEDYIAAVVERNNGYENGIDDNDVRNAAIEVFGSYPSRKAALAELSRRYPDTALNEATEAIAQLEQERDEALSQIDADLRSELADAEANPSKYERAYEEEDTWNLQFDIYTGALRKARNEVSRMERDMQKAKLTQREKTAAMRTVKRAVVDMLKGDLGRYTRKRDIQALMNAVESAQTLYSMQRAIDKAMLAINELRLRKETARMNNLLKMRISSHDSAIDPRIFFENMMKGSKNVDSAVRRLMNDYWRGVNSSGVDVAKGVDGDTARVLQFIRTHSNLTAELGKAPTEGDILKRCEAWRKELRGEAVETSVFSDTERKEIEALSPEVRERMADAVSVIEGYLMVQYQLQNMDEGVTNARQEIEAEKAQIKKLNKEIKALQGQNVAVTDGRIVDAKKEIEERKKKIEQINRDIASVRIMNAGVYIGAMPDILDAFSRLNAQVESLLMGGRVDLADFRAKREAHKKELVNMVLEALDNPEALDRNKPKPTAWQKAKDTGAVRFFTNHLGSLDYMLRSIDRNAPNGEGMVHTYFTTKLADAKDAIYENSVKAVDILDSKAQALFGTTFGRAMRKAERKVLGTMTMTRTKEDGTKITEEYEMTVATALYTMMMWNQPASRPALENMGATEEDIEQLRTWLNANNPAWLQFAGWVVNDFLPSNRARYNEAYRAMNGTDMDFAENYFPIRRMSTAIPKEVDLADPSFENKPSTVTGAIMKRTENKLPIDLETSFFGALQDNIVEMEEWSALAPIISDFNAILSSPAVKKAMGDMGKYFHNDFQQAAKVATLKYAGDTKKLDGVFWQMVYRTWASTKLAFKAFTALKQLASSVLFLPYSEDPKFWGRLLHYYLGGKGKLSDAVYEKFGDGSLTNREEGQAWLNINWALENSSMFRRRWESGVAGNDIFTRELKYDSRTKAGRFMRSISEAVDWLQKKGMAPIALIDAFTVSAGMRAIYEYELANLTQKEGYTKEEAKKIAMRRAEMIANKSQQSSEGEYLAPLQMERGWMTSLTMFQNAPFAQGRNIAEAWKEITLKPDKEYAFIKKQEIARMKKTRAAEYEAIEATIVMEKELGIITTEEQENLRREKLQRPINAEIEAQAHTATKKKMFRAKMRAYRTLAYNAFRGQFVFNLMGQVPYLLFGDDDEEKKKMWKELGWLTAFAPVGTFTAGGTLMSILGGHKVSFSGALSEFEDEWNKIISEYKNDGFFEAMLAAGDFLIRKGFGVDYETFMRMYAGIENLFESGMYAENIFMALNAPDSQVRLLAGDRKEGETAQEYATRIMRLYSIFSTPEYSDYYNEKFSYRGENPAFLMSDYMARGMKKNWEMAYRSDVMRNKGLAEEWAAVLNTEEEYEEVVEALGFKANRTPADEAGYIDGEYRAPIKGLSEDDFYRLKYLAGYAAAVAKYARTYLGGDEDTYLEYVRDEMEAKRELISEYNKILNK